MVLPYINMNLPRVYMCSPSWTPLPPLSQYHPSGSSQCTSPKHPVSCIEPGLAIRSFFPFLSILFKEDQPFDYIEVLMCISLWGFFLIFWEISILFPVAAVPIYIPTSSELKFCGLFDGGRWWVWASVSGSWFLSISLMMSGGAGICSCACGLSLWPLWNKCLFRFCPFFI